MSSVTENKKLFSLSPDVVKKLDQEENKSALVDALLANYYGIELPDDLPHMKERHEILAHLDYENEPEADPESVAVQPFVEKGKPLDGVVGPNINLLGKPAKQLDDGNLEFVDNLCATCNKPKLAGLCPTCDL